MAACNLLTDVILGPAASPMTGRVSHQHSIYRRPTSQVSSSSCLVQAYDDGLLHADLAAWSEEQNKMTWTCRWTGCKLSRPA